MSTYKKGATFTATVRDLASDGRGILSHPDGLTVFVPGVWPGEECRVRFIGLQNRVGLGELVEIIQASPARVTPSCPHHGFARGNCGGCPWKFIDYQAQLTAKQDRVNKAFARLNFHNVRPIWPSPHTYHYRNRTQLKTDGEVIGYLSANSNDIAAIQTCPVLTQPNQNTLNQLLARLPNEEWRPNMHHRKRLQWTSLNFDDAMSAADVVVNQRLPFQQSHHQQNAAMRNWLQQQLSQVTQPGPVLELFCGSGNFTATIAATLSSDILAVEGDPKALERLASKGLANVVTLCGDLFDPQTYARIYRHRKDFTTLVLDPPRDGLKQLDQLLIKNTVIRQIFYISCNLATLTRDLKSLCEQGFTIDEVQALDQTPHTPHMELLVALSK